MHCIMHTVYMFPIPGQTFTHRDATFPLDRSDLKPNYKLPSIYRVACWTHNGTFKPLLDEKKRKY